MVPTGRATRSPGTPPSPAGPRRLPWSGDPTADRLLAQDPLALLIGFVLDQQVTVQTAFRGPCGCGSGPGPWTRSGWPASTPRSWARSSPPRRRSTAFPR